MTRRLKGTRGAWMNARETSPRYRRRKARQYRAEEEAWAALAGPVVVFRVECARDRHLECPGCDCCCHAGVQP